MEGINRRIYVTIDKLYNEGVSAREIQDRLDGWSRKTEGAVPNTKKNEWQKKKVRSNMGRKPLPDGARNYVRNVLKEAGYTLEPDKFVYVKGKYYLVTLFGECPIHGRVHSSNRIQVVQTEDEWENAYIFCFHDGKTRQLSAPLTVLHQ